MMKAPTGVVRDGVVMATLQLENSRYPDWPNVDQCYAPCSMLSAGNRGSTRPASRPRRCSIPAGDFRSASTAGPQPGLTRHPIAQHVTVSAGYFETFRVRLLSGRFFQDRTRARTEPVVLINQSLAKRLFPSEDALGQRIVSTARNIGPLGQNLMFATRNVHEVPFRIVGLSPTSSRRQSASPPSRRSTTRIVSFRFAPMTIVARGPDTATVVSGDAQALHSVDRAAATRATSGP